MFNHNEILLVAGVLLSIGFIIFSVWFVSAKILVGVSEQAFLTKHVAILLAAMVALFIADKLIAVKLELLSPEISNGLFELIKYTVTLVFGFVFGVQSKSNDPK